MLRRLAAAAKWIAVYTSVLCVGCGPTGQGDDDDHAADGGAASGVDAPPDPDRPDAAACQTESVTADVALKPVDIIWVVDSSGSMSDEELAVQNALNDFSAFITQNDIDYHVILVGDAGAMSVPPPLGGSPEFMHVNVSVGSNDSLEKLVASYPQFQAFLRPGASVHVVVVTDDESDWSHSEFNSQLAALAAPGIPTDYTFHSICSEEVLLFQPPPPLPPVMGPCFGGLGQGGAAAPGVTYIDMAASTGGLWRSICESDWAPIFGAVAEAVSVPIALPCVYDLPDPPEGETLDPNRVNFVYVSSAGTETTIPRVDSQAACGGGDGWYYDDPDEPTQIYVCPTTCSVLEGDSQGQVDIAFGCATVIY